MQRTTLLSGIALFLCVSNSWGAAPLDADGLRSVLIRGRVVAPILIPLPAPLEGEVSLPAPIAEPLPPVGIGGPEPTPAAPRLIVPPGGVRPMVRPPVIPSPLRGASNSNDAGANRLADGNTKDALDKARNSDLDGPTRSRHGLFRRRR